MDSDGSLVPYADPFKSVTPEMVTLAERIQVQVQTTKAEIEHNFLRLAKLFDLVEREQLYKALQFETMWEWVASPQIEMSKRVVQDLLRIAREAIPVMKEHIALALPDGVTADEADEELEQEALARLGRAGVSKTREALRLLRHENGEDQFLQVIAKAPEQTWDQTREEVNERRGVGRAYDEASPAIFRAKVRRGQNGHSRVEVTCTTGVDVYSCGALTVKTEHAARLDHLFGRYIEYID